jgi:hypothetical protein
MAEINLTQAEADALIALEKHCVDNQTWDYPPLGGAIHIPLVSVDKREQFTLDICRGNINLLKGTYQNRARQAVILVRLDFGGACHRNPNDQEIASPHLHVYREGFGDRWAIPIPNEVFSNPTDLWQTLSDFLRYCNVTQPPLIIRGLFT